MEYSDRQNKIFSKIAYMELAERVSFYEKPEDVPPLGEMLTEEEISELKRLYHITPDELKNWKVVSAYDTNRATGFAACVIDTGDNNVSVAYRGSEKLNSKNWLPDWILGDFTLLNSNQTVQQKETEKFLKRNEKLLDSYNSISMTGHSLGGVNADHGAIISDEFSFGKKVDQCVNLDGPGFSREYIKNHKNRIDELNEKGILHHKVWSPVGEMLYNVAADKKTIATAKEIEGLTKKEKKGYNFISRHDTMYTVMDGDNMILQSGTENYSPLGPHEQAFMLATGFLTCNGCLFGLGLLSQIPISKEFIGDVSRCIDESLYYDPFGKIKTGLLIGKLSGFGLLGFGISEYLSQGYVLDDKENKNYDLAVDRSLDNTYVYINTDRMLELKKTSEGICSSLESIKVDVKKSADKNDYTVPVLNYILRNSLPYMSLYSAYLRLFHKRDIIVADNVRCTILLDECKETLKAMNGYFEEVSKTFESVEDANKKRFLEKI